MRLLVLALLLILAPGAAVRAQSCRGADDLPEPGPAAAEMVPYQFHRTADRGLACVLPPEDGAAMAAGRRAVTFLPCLKVGAVAIADTRRTVEALLGEPVAAVPVDDHTETRSYFIAQRGEPRPHYTITYRDGVAVAVQLVGPPTEMPATFAGLALGDPAQRVLDVLGRPARRCRFRPDGGETWVWPPFPIGVDVENGFVVGLKATWPAGRPTP
ncbi:hypothetical protein [Magnetospirillum sp. UT-4]|uniref:hypothetical protein n=1 Tax=Magnetospirillum sp. UT-4 TaxID=2681467 RepID=UPI0013826A27|nr:hypothetical protein [Magnetospirillum sp. UT-4]CAA7623761.1 conserved exported hypothetical protein [Magnetospirillum sp. UT-4]